MSKNAESLEHAADRHLDEFAEDVAFVLELEDGDREDDDYPGEVQDLARAEYFLALRFAAVLQANLKEHPEFDRMLARLEVLKLQLLDLL